MKIPQVSVIMPAYNHERFVGEAIESVLTQTFCDFEFIIINDGSTDMTEAVIKRYADSRIRYFCQENRGVSDALNKGSQLSRGEYISIINSDDVYHRERLEILLNRARAKNLTFLITDISLIDEHSNTIDDPAHWWIAWFELLKSIYRLSSSPEKAFLAGNYAISTSNFFLKSSAIKEVGRFNPYNYISDYDFAFRIAKNQPRGFEFLHDAKLLLYRLHRDNTIAKDPLIANEETFSFLIEAIKAVFGRELEIPLDHLNKIKDHIAQEGRSKSQELQHTLDELRRTVAQHQSYATHLRNELLTKSQELQQRLDELQDSLRYSVRLLDEISRIKSSWSFRIGRLLAFPLTAIKKTSLAGNHTTPLKVRVNGVEQLNVHLDALIKNARLVSFDIFDTILERDVEPPDKVKEIAARPIAGLLKAAYNVEYSVQDLMKLRQTVELEFRGDALSRGNDFECRYSNIVREMVSRILGYYDKQLFSAIVKHEIEAENEVLTIKAGVTNVLSHVRRSGKKIIAISDMYLDKEYIQTLLRLKSLDKFFDEIYVSSEMSLSKGSSSLFKHVLAKEKISPLDMVHIGDNRISDYRIPYGVGINAVYFKDRLHLKKKYLLKTYNWLAGHNPYWRGRHLLQLIRPSVDPDNFFYRYGFSFLGPVYSAFMLGVVETVKANRIKQVFFLARDGELFLRLFNDVFAPCFFRESDMPRARYAFLTRKSTMLASVHKGLSYEKAVIPFYNPKQQGLYSILSVLGLPVEEVAGIAQDIGFKEIEAPIHDWHDERLSRLLHDQRFQHLVTKYAKRERDLLDKYLAQLGFFGCEIVAFVDIGWNATIQKFIQDAFIEREDYPYVFGIYLGFVNGLRHNLDPAKNTIVGLLYDERRNSPAENALSRFEEIFEEGARAFHPTTVGYKENMESGLIEPVFKDWAAFERTTELIDNKKIYQIQRGAEDFSREFVRAVKLTGYCFEDIKPFLLMLIERCVVFPDAEETHHLLTFTHSEDFGHQSVMDFKEDKIGRLDVFFDPRKFIQKIRSSNWIHGSARSSGIPGINLLLRLYDILKRL